MTTNAAERRRLLAEMEIINANLTNACDQVRLLRNLIGDLSNDLRRILDGYRTLATLATDELRDPA